MGFAKLFGAWEGVFIQMDGAGGGYKGTVSTLFGSHGLYPKYLSNLFRAWKTDNTHSGNHSHPEGMLARACGCSCSAWHSSSAHLQLITEPWGLNGGISEALM